MEPFLLSSSLTGRDGRSDWFARCVPIAASPRLPPTKKNACWGLPMRMPSLCTIRRAAPPVITKVFADVPAIHELIVVDATLRDLIHRQAGELELERYVRQHSAGIRSNGIEKVLAGRNLSR
ncbi:type II secretion system protein E [Escherichia coli]|nr:type II secretion system protein E [Escherichia coli]